MLRQSCKNIKQYHIYTKVLLTIEHTNKHKMFLKFTKHFSNGSLLGLDCDSIFILDFGLLVELNGSLTHLALVWVPCINKAVLNSSLRFILANLYVTFLHI